MERRASGGSPSSSVDSCSGQPVALTTAPAVNTDLRLGLGLESCSFSIHTDNSAPSTPRSALTISATTTAAAYHRGSGRQGRHRSLFVKVYMDGVPIGRKLDLQQLGGYNGLVAQLRRMFKASVAYPDGMGGHHQVVLGQKQARHVLTYEDQEGDWLMVGDVPWELFLTSVKKLRISRADNCERQ